MPTDFKSLVEIFYDLIKLLIPIAASLALLAFFWGLAKFIFNASGDAKAVQEGKNIMLWGTLALFVLISVWGILRFLSGELGFGSLGIPFLPEG
jgi:hypothetical protein